MAQVYFFVTNNHLTPLDCITDQAKTHTHTHTDTDKLSLCSSNMPENFPGTYNCGQPQITLLTLFHIISENL